MKRRWDRREKKNNVHDSTELAVAAASYSQ